MFQMKEKQDSYQLDLSMILDIKQRIARLSPESQEKYNLWLDKIISEQKQDSFGPNMDWRGQLCNLFAEVDFEQKAMINPKIYHEFFHQFSFYVSSNELDAVLITHTHSDHVNGLKTFVKKHDIPIFMSELMIHDLDYKINNVEYINSATLYIKDIMIKYFIL